MSEFQPIADAYSPGTSSSSNLLEFISIFRAFTELSPKGRELRKRAFANADGNGNGMCSFAELETFVQNELMTSKKNGKTLFKTFRPSYIRAFVALTSIEKKKKDGNGEKAEDDTLQGTVNAIKDDYVTYAQFRLWNIFLVIHAAMYDAFATVDGEGEGRTEDDDMRIEKSEWMNCYANVQECGFLGLKQVTNDEEANSVFDSMDVDNGGMVLLNEWCRYLSGAEVEADTAMGKLLSGNIELKVTELSESEKAKKKQLREQRKSIVEKNKKQEVTLTPAEKEKLMSPIAGGVYKPGISSSPDLLEFLMVFRPYAEKDTVGYKLRRDGFSIADGNGNNLCSLSELEGYIRATLLTKIEDDNRAKQLFAAFRPCYIRAFQNAKDVKVEVNEDHKEIKHTISFESEATYDDYVTFDEFRYFNVYLCIYAGMFDAFATIDGRGAGRDENDDKRIELSEWMDCRGNVQHHGFAALEGIGDLDEDMAKILFEEMDDNGGGMVLLSEWCEYLTKKEVERGTPMGDMLTARFEVQAKKPRARRQSTIVDAAHPSEFSKLSARSIRTTDLTDKPVIVAEAYQPGISSSKDLIDFVRIFAPYAEKNDEAMKMRRKGYSVADTNANGECSLAELENFISSTLLGSFVGNVRGRSLFALFRPSYIKAYNAAKAIKRNDGSVLAGTKNATEDDFVSLCEFRVFNAYLCIYAGMFDAFARIDGMGEGRDENDDMRVDLNEWMTCYETVKDHGFVAFKNVSNDEEARAAFQSMDDNDGGKVLLGEWCEYVKKAEIEEKTKMGKLLSGDLKPTAVSSPKQKKSIKTPTKAAAKKVPSRRIPKSLKVADVFIPGDSSTDELLDFIHAFRPLAVKSQEGTKLRHSKFSLADTNGNGCCSLAEIDSFIKATLLKEFPQGKGLKLFFTFRPSYIRAYQEAKGIAQDAKKVRGAKDATDDDYITFAEFRILNAFLCIYAAMYDVFARVDGEGEGRDENDDMRIELSEWMSCYRKVKDRGFVALKNVKSDNEAKGVFKKMDADGGGMVLLKEWCDFLKKEEMAKKTTLGVFFQKLRKH